MYEKINESVKWYEKDIAANPDDKVSYWNLGLAYLNKSSLGKSEFRDKKAYELFLKAARLGYRNAFEQVAFMYEHGVGTDKDLRKARYWQDKH